MRVNTTIVAMDLSHVKYLKRSIFFVLLLFFFISFLIGPYTVFLLPGRIPNPSVSALCESFAVHKTLSTLKCKNSSLTFECCVSIATYLASSSTLRTLSLAANSIDESVRR
jgi:hypothetical protein